MADFVIAKALHVVAVVLWIGGVAMVTTVLLPTLRRTTPPEQVLPRFHQLEQRFAAQARWTTAIAGATGFYMTWRLDGWSRFQSVDFWWMHAMVLTWAIFTAMLFVLEPLVVDRLLHRLAARDPGLAYRVVQRLPWVLLTLSLVTVAGAVAGSNGVNLLGW